MPDNKPESYSDARLDEISREVFYKALTDIKAELGNGSIASASKCEIIRSLAAVADAASCGFDDKGDEGDE
jgi:hypothetical protein